MSNGIYMKLTHVQGEVLLAAADSDLINREFSSGKLKIKVLPEFYGETSVNDVTFLSSLGICTIANLVGKHAIEVDVIFSEKDISAFLLFSHENALNSDSVSWKKPSSDIVLHYY